MCNIKRKIRSVYFRLGLLITLGCVVGGSACQSASSTILPTSTPFSPIPPQEELPEFLLRMHPTDFVLQGTLNSVSATLLVDEITLSGDVTDWNDRVVLLIDETPIPVAIRLEEFESEPGRVLIVGRQQLELGRHTATIRVAQLSPHPTLEYSWEFDILAEEPAFPGLPEGLQFVRPLPNSVISQHTYREGFVIPSRYLSRSAGADQRNGVCMGTMPESDIYVYQFITLDRRRPKNDDIIIGSKTSLSSITCWYVDLAPGQHEVVAKINKASGEEIEYTWQFTIVPDE